MAKRTVNNEIPRVSPEDVLTRYRSLVPADTIACIISELNLPLPQAIRINQIKGMQFANMDRWRAKYGWEVKPVPYCSAGWQVISAAIPPSQTVEHLMGAYYIQEASSMLPAELFDYDLDRPELVLDLAASPGGKTTHLVDKLGDRGLVIANDASRSRIQALRLALERWGVVNTAVTCQPGDLFGVWFPGVFDKVLIDAPCSMEGLRTAESHPMRPITEHERESLSHRQIWLLQSALNCVRVGGQVVYSTCTLAPEEDEHVLMAIKKKYGSGVEIIVPRLHVAAPPLSLPGEEDFPDLEHALRIWPYLYNTAGFFSALIRKDASLDEVSDNLPPKRDWERQGWIKLNMREFKDLRSLFSDQYGSELMAIADSQDFSLWKRNGRIFAIPELLLEHFRDFPTISSGMELGSMINGKLILSHEWAARFSSRFTAGKLIMPVDLEPLWLHGSDIPLQVTEEFGQGSVICVFDEQLQFLGRGKVLSGRIKNLLPRRLLA